MSNINRVIVSGHMVRDPDLRATANGMSVLNFSIAVNDARKNQQTGQWEEFPNFIDCTLFGKRADSLSHILAKGSLIVVEGKLRQNSWEKDGQRRSKVEIIAEEIEIMSRKQEQQYQPAQSYQAAPVYDDLPWE